MAVGVMAHFKIFKIFRPYTAFVYFYSDEDNYGGSRIRLPEDPSHRVRLDAQSISVAA